MSNFKKAFSFRNGVQVDTDNFVVTTAGLVGIGTTIPTEYFHVLGNAKFEDNINIGSVVVNGIGTFGQVKLGTAITMSADSGIITATAFYGDGATLSNLPTSQWQDVDPGLGFTSIYAVGNVGVGTDDPTGNYVFQVGSDPSTDDLLPGVGIGSDGNAHFSGIITAFGGVDLSGSSNIESLVIDADGSQGTNDAFIVGNNKVRVRSDVGNIYSQGSITLGVGYPSTSSGVVLNPNGTSQFNGSVTINSNATITGFTTTGSFYSAGISTFADSVEIVGNAGIGSLSVSGVTTFGPGLAGDEGDIDFQHNGVTRAYWDSSAGTLNFKDGDGITLGTDEDFRISFDGSNTYLTNGSGKSTSDLYIQSDEILLRRYDGGQTMAQFTEGASVKLNYAGVTKIQTTADGVLVGGTVDAGSLHASSNIGVGTDDPQSTLQVEADTNARLDVITTNPQFPAIVSIGTAILGNERGELRYEEGVLNINNYDTRGIRINMNEGTNGTPQENFAVVLDGQEILSISGERKVGINKALPEKELDIVGELLVTGNANIVGVVTVGVGANLFTFGDGSPLPIPETQNFNTISGISTFNGLNAIGNVSIGNTLTIAADLYLFDNSPTAALNFVGIRTDDADDNALAVYGDAWLQGGVATRDHFYFTQNLTGDKLTNPRPATQDPLSQIVPFLDYGEFQVHTQGGSTFVSTQFLILPYPIVPAPGYGEPDQGVAFDDGGTGFLSVVGINTVFPRSILDVGVASTTISSYFIPPSMPQASIDIVTELWDPNGTETGNQGHVEAYKKTPNGIVPGAIIYNETSNELEVGIGPKQFAPLGVPIGGIIMWSGTIANVPAGYKLCDGNDGTPDLRDKFIIGAGNNYAVADTVGVTTSAGTDAYALAYIMRTNA